MFNQFKSVFVYPLINIFTLTVKITLIRAQRVLLSCVRTSNSCAIDVRALLFLTAAQASQFVTKSFSADTIQNEINAVISELQHVYRCPYKVVH